MIAMSRLRPDRVRLAADENTHIWEPEETQTLKSGSALASSQYAPGAPSNALGYQTGDSIMPSHSPSNRDESIQEHDLYL